jgi:heme oxygenase (biliverdin-IX-beta and delta-forming)
MQPTNRRFDLRERTREAHETVDSVVGHWSSSADYVAYLRSIHAFRSHYEAALDAIDMPVTFGSWRVGRVAQATTSDLGDLGFAAPASLPQVRLDPDLSSLLGTIYVLEGSGLGARLLCQRASALGLTAERGARHLFLLAGRAEAWRAFGAILESAPAYDADRAAHAARATFHDAALAFRGELIDA